VRAPRVPFGEMPSSACTAGLGVGSSSWTLDEFTTRTRMERKGKAPKFTSRLARPGLGVTREALRGERAEPGPWTLLASQTCKAAGIRASQSAGGAAGSLAYAARAPTCHQGAASRSPWTWQSLRCDPQVRDMRAEGETFYLSGVMYRSETNVITNKAQWKLAFPCQPCASSLKFLRINFVIREVKIFK
jgi:hypothetical protein